MAWLLGDHRFSGDQQSRDRGRALQSGANHFRGVLPVVVTLVGWPMAIRGAGLLARSPGVTMKLFEASRYEQLFHFYMGAERGPSERDKNDR